VAAAIEAALVVASRLRLDARMVAELHIEAIESAPGSARRWALVLHGVFGSGSNWRLFMRKLAAARPEWGFALVDLRGHARSPAGHAPHTVAAVAADLRALEARLDGPVRGVVGHSLGGKIALAYAALRPGELDRVWVLDSHPGVRDDPADVPTMKVLELLERLPARFDSRPAFVHAVQQAGQSRMLASWLAMNVRRGDDGHRLQLALPVVRAILEDYFRDDRWGEIERRDAMRELHLVVGGRSFVIDGATRERLAAIASDVPSVHQHVLEQAGHWLHVDAGHALLQMMTDYM
jgi:pimeloyl-ACP methyl ester carboxylesterase